jgi:hypothetical protein
MKKATLFIGLGVVMGAVFCFGRGESTAPVASGCNERYRMFSPHLPSGPGVSEVYVVDTQTGRVWRQMFYTDIKGFYMVPQPYLTADQLTVSTTPPGGVAMAEDLSLQKQYGRELERVRQKSSGDK